MSKSKKIIFLLPDLRGGGAERVCLDLASEFARNGFEVEFWLLSYCGEFLGEALSQFTVINLGVTRIRALPRPLLRALRNRRPDCVIAGMWPLTAIAPILARLSLSGSKTLCVEHCLLSLQYQSSGFLNNLARKLSTIIGYRCATALAGVSVGVARDMEGIASLRHGSVDVLHNPIRGLVIRSNSKHDLAQSSEHGEPKYLLSVGNLKPEKHQALLLEAVSLLGHLNIHLTILGEGEQRADLEKRIAALNLECRVTLAGFRPDVENYYAEADLFVLSSDYEGFGNVIVEALAFGIPIVSTDCPSGPAEILLDGKYGSLTPVGNAQALASAIEHALAAPLDPAMLRTRASDFSVSRIARQYLDLIAVT